MIPAQTSQVLFGAVVAVFYACSATAIGFLLLSVFLPRTPTAVRANINRLAFLWFCFVMGQGVLGLLWLVLSLAGIFHAPVIWTVCLVGLFSASVTLGLRRRNISAGEPRLIDFSASLRIRSWYFWLAVGIVTLSLLRGVIALLPPSVDDAINWYLPVAKLIATTHVLEFQPAITPHSGLYPLQVEMHLAALYSISTEAAVTFWDYLCGLSFLGGVGLLSWSLTASRRVALLAILMLLSTSMFYDMIGSCKVDNAGAQYGVAAFIWLAHWPVLGRRSAALAGLSIGWAMASRYPNVVLVAGLLLFAFLMARHIWTERRVRLTQKLFWSQWSPSLVVGGFAATIVVVPMLLKNWLLVSCPLAPFYGCSGTFWSKINETALAIPNISTVDLLLYPFTLTFVRRGGMLGNISPLFLGFLPFLLLYFRRLTLSPAVIAGLAGLTSIVALMILAPFLLYPRLFLVSFGLLAISLSSAIVAAEEDRPNDRTVIWLMRVPLVVILCFMLFESRAAIYGARYFAAMDSREAKYKSNPGYAVSFWLNTNLRPGQRVALGGYKGARYLVSTELLLTSESAEERQRLWEQCQWRYDSYGSVYCTSWTPGLLNFYAERGFDYIVVANDHMPDVIPTDLTGVSKVQLRVAFSGGENTVLMIANSPRLARKG